MTLEVVAVAYVMLSMSPVCGWSRIAGFVTLNGVAFVARFRRCCMSATGAKSTVRSRRAIANLLVSGYISKSSWVSFNTSSRTSIERVIPTSFPSWFTIFDGLNSTQPNWPFFVLTPVEKRGIPVAPSVVPLLRLV